MTPLPGERRDLLWLRQEGSLPESLQGKIGPQAQQRRVRSAGGTVRSTGAAILGVISRLTGAAILGTVQHIA